MSIDQKEVEAILAKNYWNIVGYESPMAPADLARLTISILNLNGLEVVEKDNAKV